MGGLVIPEAARRLNKQTLALIGVESFTDVERELNKEQLAEFLVPFESDFRKATDSFVREMFVYDSNPELVERIVADMSATPSEIGIGAFKGMVKSYPTSRVLDDFNLPLFAINADGLRPTNIESAKRAGIDVVILRDRGHFVQLEGPVRFNEVLSEIIEKVTQTKR